MSDGKRPIPLGGTPLTDLVTKEQLEEMIRKSGHSGKFFAHVRAEEQIRAGTSPEVVAPQKVGQLFARGETVWDRGKERAATIVKLNVGQSPSGKAIHRLVDAQGNAWTQRENRLSKRRP